MNFEELTEAHKTFSRGVRISDDQLKALLKYYKTLDDTLSSCRMDHYDLFHNDVRRNRYEIERIIEARKERY